jgi:NAD-dependent deacetylase
VSTGQLKSIIAQSANIVFFGGAGVSTESNIPDFRSEDGIYKTENKYGFPPQVLLSHTFFLKHPDIFYDYYKTTMIYKDAKPNAAHFALAELEKQCKLKAIITQNIDGLHQKAGSDNVLELHGSVYNNYCTECCASYDLDTIIHSVGIPKCICGGIIKPDVVLYGEPLDYDVIHKSTNYISKAEVLIVGGTSLSVYPAASLIKYFKGNKLILINKSQTKFDDVADILICDSVGKVLSEAVLQKVS